MQCVGMRSSTGHRLSAAKRTRGRRPSIESLLSEGFADMRSRLEDLRQLNLGWTKIYDGS